MANTSTGLMRREVVQQLLCDRKDMLVITGLGSPTYDVFAAGDDDANFYLWGAMGGTGIMALGLALAQPDRPVTAITGDGEQLMGIGGLLTVSVKKPANLNIVVLDNGHFGETGMQRSHAGLGINLADVARGVGFKQVLTPTTSEQVIACREQLHECATPTFAHIVIDTKTPERVLPPRDGVYLKNRFRQHLGFGVN